MADYVSPSDLAALNAAVKTTEASTSAKRAALAVLERIASSREAAGLEDHELFAAIARGSSKKSGLHWLCRLNGTLVEYLTSWGTLVLFSVSLISTLVVIKQNAKRVWGMFTDFVTKHPFVTAGLGFGLGVGAGMLLKDGEEEAACDVLSGAVRASLPGPIAAVVGGMTDTIAKGDTRNAAPITSVGGPIQGNINPANVVNIPQGMSVGSIFTGGSLSIPPKPDAYDARDAYDAYDARDEQSDEFSGNIG
jgi:hypothetical protein